MIKRIYRYLLLCTCMIVLLTGIFSTITVNASTVPTVATGTYYIRNMKNGLYLDVTNGSSAIGTNVQVWTSNKTQAQQWSIVKLSTDHYVIRTSLNTNMALDVKSNYTSDYSNIDIFYAGSTNTSDIVADYMEWYIRRNNDGTVSFTSYASNKQKYLDCYNGGMDKGTSVIQCGWNGNPSMRWILESTTITSSILNWNLVDSGEHMDWSGSSKYVTNFKNAVNTWNKYAGETIIRKDGALTIEDLVISDYSLDDGNYAYTSPDGTMHFNTLNMDTLKTLDSNGYIQDALIEDICLHELGHALGLDHTLNYGDVMNKEYVVSYINPRLNDLKSFSDAKKKY